MAKEYLRQETIVPAKQLGRFAGFAIGAAIAFSLGTLFLSVATVRYIQKALPSGPNWEALGYVLAALAMVLVIGILLKVTASRTSAAGRPSKRS